MLNGDSKTPEPNTNSMDGKDISVNDSRGVQQTFTNDLEGIIPECKSAVLERFGKTVSCSGIDIADGPKFFKGCKWSPDDMGNRVLTCNGHNKLTVYHAFLNKLDYRSSQISNDKYEIRDIGNIYDFDWYPRVRSSEYHAVTATSLKPVHIYDIQSSKSIASYLMYNTNDEMISARCIGCVSDGSRIISGTKDYIFIFDVNRPGRNYDRIQTREKFRRGIISTIAVHPWRHTLFAVGSYNNRIGLYDEQHLLCLFFGHSRGLTHLKFSPNGLLLYSGTRGCGDIICWDLRQPGKALYKLVRTVRTQQRIYFDTTPSGRYILSGSTIGDVYVWDSKVPPVSTVLPPVHQFRAHNDCTNGLSVHSRLPYFTTSSGQYHFADSVDSDDDENCSIESENSLKLWHIDL